MGNIYADALAAQSACNLSGLVHSLSKHLDAVWAEAHALHQGTDFVNQHPAVRLFVHQIHYLAFGTEDTLHPARDTYRNAFAICQVKARASS